MAHNKLHHSNLNEFALDEDARVFFDLQHLTEDSVPKDNILSRKKNEKDSKEERQDLNPSLSVTEEEDSDETGQRNVNNSLNNSHFESLTDMSQLSEAYDDSLKKKRQKAKGSTKKWNVEKKTSEAFQPFIPKPKTFTGSATGNKKTSQKMTFKTKPKISSSSSNRKSRSRFSKPPCKHCENCNGNKKGSPCIKYYFTNLFKNSNETISIEDGLLKIEERKTKNKKIGLDAGKVNEDISDCINGEETFSADAKNGKSSKIYQNEPILTIKVEQREPTNNGDVPNADSAESNGKSKIRNKRKSIPIKRPIKEIFPKRLERRTTEESSKLVEIVKSPQENHLTQKDAEKIAVTNHVQFIKRKTSKIPSKKLSQIIQSVESGSEGSKHALDMPLFSDSYSDEHNQNQEETKKMDKICAIAEQKIGENHTEEVQAQQSEEKMKTLDEISIIINNKENNKSRRALRMLELFGSCSEDSDQSVDYNIHDDNNNTHVNSAQPYLLMKELHQTDQDDCHAPLKKLKYSSEGIEMPQIDLHKRREPRHRKNQTKVNKKHLNKNDKSNLLSSNVKKNIDGSNKLKSDTSKNLKSKLKNKYTQTEKTKLKNKSSEVNTFTAPRRPRGRPVTKPVINFIVTQTKNNDYNVSTHVINKKYSYPRNTCDLGPNPRPKFRIVPAYRPYTLKPEKTTDGKYPNRFIESGLVVPNSCRAADVSSEKNNHAVLISNQLLENYQSFECAEVEKPNDLEELNKIKAFNVETQNSDTLSSQEKKNIDTLVNLYDDIESNLFGNDAFSPSFSSNSSGRFSISKVFRSICDGGMDPQEEAEEKVPLETSSDQIDGVNISTSLSNYRQDMKRNHDNIMEKLERSFVDLFNSTTLITEGGSISGRLILESLNGQDTEDVSDVGKGHVRLSMKI